MWSAVIAFSVLAHELGHAAVCLAWGKGADIVLRGFGATKNAMRFLFSVSASR